MTIKQAPEGRQAFLAPFQGSVLLPLLPRAALRLPGATGFRASGARIGLVPHVSWETRIGFALKAVRLKAKGLDLEA